MLTAAHGEKGITKARSEVPHLILLDMLMPKLSGLETLEEFKKDETTSSIPVVILSNSSIEADVQKAKALGVIGYLVKASLSLQELTDQVRSYLKETNPTVTAQI